MTMRSGHMHNQCMILKNVWKRSAHTSDCSPVQCMVTPIMTYVIFDQPPFLSIYVMVECDPLTLVWSLSEGCWNALYRFPCMSHAETTCTVSSTLFMAPLFRRYLCNLRKYRPHLTIDHIKIKLPLKFRYIWLQ